jgi:phenylacetate-CoA ligase
MVLVRGVNLYPSAVEQVLRSCGGVGEFRVEISGDRALPEMSLHIEPASEHEDPTHLGHRVEAAFQNAFGLRAAVTCVRYGTLPRFEGKAQRWLRR